MKRLGFFKVGLPSFDLAIGNPMLNKKEILRILDGSTADITLFFELTLTGYSSSDLFYHSSLLVGAKNALWEIVKNTCYQGLYLIGLPLEINSVIYNVAAVCFKNQVLGFVPKSYLPNTHEFSERRWFHNWDMEKGVIQVEFFGSKVSFGNLLFRDQNHNLILGVEICEDMWVLYSPSDDMCLTGANMILNLSSSPEIALKSSARKNTVIEHSRKQLSAYLYNGGSSFDSSSEVVFSNHRLASSLGKLVKEEKAFSSKELLVVDIDIDQVNYQRRMDSIYSDLCSQNKYIYQVIDISFSDEYQLSNIPSKLPFYYSDLELSNIFEILVNALIRKVASLKEHLRKVVIGLSGGLDSTLALLIAYQAFKNKGYDFNKIITVFMPSVVTSKRSQEKVFALLKGLDLKGLNIDIQNELKVHLDSLNHQEHDVTFENAQARIRTLCLMNIANKEKGFVLGTGDMSEIALGFMTYNGDQMSMYGINSGIPKTLVRFLIKYLSLRDFSFIADVLNKVLDDPISPELLENQVTEDYLGSYEINDFILYYFIVVGASKEKIIALLEVVFSLSFKESTIYVNRFFKRFFANQFKRQTLPEGPKVIEFSLSPRSGFKLPSDISNEES